MARLLFLSIGAVLLGCTEHHVDTFPEWCEQISGVDLEKKYDRFWAVIFSVSFDAEAIRDDYTNVLNESHLEKVQNRTDKMAWRKGTELHLVNLSSFFVLEPSKVIEEWRHGIELNKQFKHQHPADKCLYGTLTSMFDSLHMHSMESEALGNNWSDTVTVISTDREKRLGTKRL